MSKDTIYRQDAIDAIHREARLAGGSVAVQYADMFQEALLDLPSVHPEPREVVPHRNYQYLSDYWCECGWHLGKKGDVKYCPDCGRKVIWDG